MGQTEILELLKKSKGWFSSKEIAKKMGVNNGPVTRSLGVLRKSGEVFNKVDKERPQRILYKGK